MVIAPQSAANAVAKPVFRPDGWVPIRRDIPPWARQGNGFREKFQGYILSQNVLVVGATGVDSQAGC